MSEDRDANGAARSGRSLLAAITFNVIVYGLLLAACFGLYMLVRAAYFAGG